MKEFFGDLLEGYFEFFQEGPLGIFLGILLTLLIAIITALVAWLMFIAIDSWCLDIQKDTGTVVGKHFTHAYMELMPVSTGKTVTIIPIYHPDNWELTFEVANGIDNASVLQTYYNAVSIGYKTQVGYVKGRISGDVYIKEIY